MKKTSALLILLLAALACSLPGVAGNPTEAPASQPPTETQLAPPTETSVPPTVTETVAVSPTVEAPTATLAVIHALVPVNTVETGKLFFDVSSVDTAAENRAPYGDSYNISLFERPFLQDMTYVPDLDIASFNISRDEKFFFVSIELVGSNPNNPLGIDYAVELDLNADGFGDYLIVARPPHSFEWATDNVQVWQDTNLDTGGLSAEKSDAPLPGNGFDTLIFDGGRGPDDDPDLAWVRVNAGKYATVQFAFKRTWAGDRFMFGVFADAGKKDISDYDYVDRLTKAEAGSPIRSDADYPLKGLFAIDNTCRETQGMTGGGEEPKLCPRD